MKTLRKAPHLITYATIAAFSIATIPMPTAQAAMVGTDRAVHDTAASGGHERLQNFLGRDGVAEQLETYGLTKAEAEQRLAGLTDEEAANLADRLDAMPAGQGIGVIIGVAIFAVVVLFITDIAGVTNVFGFVNKPAQR